MSSTADPGELSPTEESSDPGEAADGSRSSSSQTGIVVLGMHRSGTSALTRTLNLLGGALPGSLLGATESNPLGYWESSHLKERHDRLLFDLDTRWDEWTPIPEDWFESAAAAQYAEDFAAFLHKAFRRKPLFVLKDPRMSRVVPLWRRAFDLAGIEMRAAISVRSAFEVAASLAVRDEMAPSKAMLVWLRYVCDIERTTRDMPRCFVRFDSLLADWRNVTADISDKLGVPWPRQTLRSAHEIDGFLSAQARHHVAPDAWIEKPGVQPWVKAASIALGDLSEAPYSPSALQSFDSLRAQFDTAATAIWPALADETQAIVQRDAQTRHQLKADRAEAVGQVERLRTELAAREQALQESERAGERLKGELSGLERRVSHLDEALRSETQRTTDLRRELDAEQTQHRQEMDRIQDALRERSDEVQRLGGRLAEQEEELGREAARWRGVAQRLAEEIGAKTRLALDRARSEVAAITSELESAQAQRMQALEALAAHRDQLREFERQGTRLRASHDQAIEALAAATLQAESLRRQLGEVQKERSDVAARASELQDRILELQSKGDAQKARVNELKAERATLRAAAERADKELRKTSLARERAEADRAELQSRLGTFKANRAVMAELLAARTAAVDALAQEVAELQAARDGLMASASWRITSPIRRVEALRQRLLKPVKPSG